MIKEILFPRRCYVCDGLLNLWEQEDGIHRECRELVSMIGDSGCLHCGAFVQHGREYCPNCEKLYATGKEISVQHRNIQMEHDSFNQGKSLFVYQGAMKESMYRFKYGNRREYADIFARLAARQYGEWIFEKEIDTIIPVPMYRGKKRSRGYNQAECFAVALARELSRAGKNKNAVRPSVNIRLVCRNRATAPMKTLSREERYRNLKNAFMLSPFMVNYCKNVLVVDDIYTTGATAMAVTQILRDAGIKNVYFMSICIVKSV